MKRTNQSPQEREREELERQVEVLCREVQQLRLEQDLLNKANELLKKGLEMHGHKQFTMATDIQVYFCDPHSPWQRGSNENTNGLLRQYMPKGIDISGYSQLQLNAIARQLNERPCKTLGFLRPLRCSANVLH